MSLLCALRQHARLNALRVPRRCYAAKPATHVSQGLTTAPWQTASDAMTEPTSGSRKSACREHTVMTGLAYLKGQPEVVALADDAYPPWLWDLLKKRELEDDGPGGRAEKVRLRRENRQRIRDQNFMKTQ